MASLDAFLEGHARVEKELRFAPGPPDVFVVEDVRDEEHELIWYTSTDLRMIRSSIKATKYELKRCLAHGHEVDEDEHCLRGLEDKVMRYKLPRRERVSSYVLAVLDKQFEQATEGSPNPRELRRFASSLSKGAREYARALGVKDAKEVAQEMKKEIVQAAETLDVDVLLRAAMDVAASRKEKQPQAAPSQGKRLRAFRRGSMDSCNDSVCSIDSTRGTRARIFRRLSLSRRSSLTGSKKNLLENQPIHENMVAAA